MKNSYWLIIVLVIIVIGGILYLVLRADDSAPEVQEAKGTYTDVDSAEAYKLINENSEMVILDVSPNYDKGHLPGAINHYVGDGSLDKAIPNLDKNKTHLVYCHVDSVAISGAQKLVDAGFSKVYRLTGNYSAWFDGGYPVEVEIQAVGSYSGSALAVRSYLDGKFSHSVEADISDPASGKFYEGWLVKGSSFFSTGKMTKENGKYVLKYQSTDDQRDYNEVVITEETESLGLDGNPEAHVLEGEFETN